MVDDRDPKLLDTEISLIAFAAQRLFELGLVVVPCDAKRPLIKGWSRLTKAQIQCLSRRWPERFPGANVAIVCGASSIVVVDIDDADLLPQMIERFGETPILIASPSGGFHAYYRNLDPPVGCLNLRQTEGLPVDIKGDGGLVVAPPSLNRATGGVYQFFRGCWADLRSLPVIRSSGLPADRARGRPSSLARTKIARRVKIGQRNDTLFREGLKHAPYCDDFDTLLDVIQTKNDFLLEAPVGTKIGAAHAGRFDLQDNVTRTGRRVAEIHHIQCAVACKGNAFHLRSPNLLRALCIGRKVSQHSRFRTPTMVSGKFSQANVIHPMVEFESTFEAL